MTPQEREVINSIFDRLKGAANQPRDPEAEKHIAGLVAQQPYAVYALAQSVYVQEQALTNLQSQVDALHGEIARLQQAAQAAPQQSGGFLSGLFGGGSRPQPQPQPMAPRPGPWGGQPQGGMPMQQGGPWGGQQAQSGPWGGQQAAPQQGGGFLASALTTAAGVAGGMVVGNMLMNAFKGGGSTQSASSDFQPFGGQSQPSSAQDQAMLDQAEAYDAGYDDGGDFGGGGGDSYEA